MHSVKTNQNIANSYTNGFLSKIKEKFTFSKPILICFDSNNKFYLGLIYSNDENKYVSELAVIIFYEFHDTRSNQLYITMVAIFFILVGQR